MELSDEELIEQYKAGDETQLGILIERHFRSIYSYVYRFVHNAPEAQDVVQEVFIKVWRQIDTFKPGTGLRPWLFRIARNTAIDHLRKKKAIPFSSFEDDNNEAVFEDKSSNILEESMAREEKDILNDAIEQLPLQYRDVLVLRAEENLTFDEIGVTVGKPLNTVKSLYRRGLEKLHQILLAKRSN